MIIAGVYSFNKGKEIIEKKYFYLLKEIENVIANIDSKQYMIKESKEKTMPGKMLFSPISLNQAFKREFSKLDWKCVRIKCEYPTCYYTKDYTPDKISGSPFREMDFIKEKLGVEVQFGKYAFMVYNVAAKMTIFRNLSFIDTGIEIVPVKALADEMSSGMSYFEQFIWDLQKRGISNIDVPVLILGIDV